MNDDYVKRSDVHKAFQPKYAPAINKTFAAMIDSVPAADVVEVRHGRWEQVEILHVEDLKEEDKDCISIASMFCPKCKRYHNEVYMYGSPTESVRFCPNCGAKMDGG